MKKLAALLLCLLMMNTAALAEIDWPEHPTAGQAALQTYVDRVNQALTYLGEGQIDTRYELYATFASLGMDGAEMPEGFSETFTLSVEMYYVLSEDGLYSLQLRMCDLDRFPGVAAACLYAASPATLGIEQALDITRGYAAIAKADVAAAQQALQNDEIPLRSSFEEEVVALQGSQPRAYFAYYPDQYMDDRDWLQMTIIFPLPGSEGGSLVLPVATPMPDADIEYEGYFSKDSYTHLEVFVSPTPEPDSAAMEP